MSWYKIKRALLFLRYLYNLIKITTKTENIIWQLHDNSSMSLNYGSCDQDLVRNMTGWVELGSFRGLASARNTTTRSRCRCSMRAAYGRSNLTSQYS